MSSPVPDATPVIIGVGQTLDRTDDPAEAAEPATLMADAVRAAFADAGVAGPSRVDSIRVVGSLSWRYGNPAWAVGRQLGVEAGQLAVTAMGGNSPQSLVNTTAREIAAGELDLAILTGGEAWRTRMRARRDGVHLDWAKAPAEIDTPVLGTELTMSSPEELSRGIVMPVQVYPMFETAIRAAAGRSVADHQRFIATLWSRFSEVAAANPAAWIQQRFSPEEIGVATPENRYIGLPYTKRLNSNNDVNMGAALVMCSAATARSLGVAPDRWIFPQSGTDCHEHPFISHRDTYDRTPAIELGGARALELADTSIDDVELVDLYSCFPSAVELGAQSLGLSLDGQLTRTGGLAYAGGPWNNYPMHAIATIVGELRERPDATAFVWANGGFATKHAFGVYATTPPSDGFRWETPQDRIDALPRRELAPPADATGPATIEAYTVMHDRENQPEQAIAACRLPDGRRAWGTSGEADVTRSMCDGEWVGQPVQLDADGGLRLP